MKTKSISSRPALSLIEPLEARIAPAAVFSFTDVDGDKVTIKTSKGNNADLANAAHVVVGQLRLLDLSSATFGGEFDGADITFSAKPQGGLGDGHVNVGFINATGRDLGQVTVPGDLGRILAGDLSSPAPALKSLHAASIGGFGLSTQAAGGDLTSVFQGKVGKLTIDGTISNAELQLLGGSASTLGILKVGADFAESSLLAGGNVGSVNIGGSLVGGSVMESGSIISFGNIKSIRIGGAVHGGSGGFSGTITATGKIGSLTIGGDLTGLGPDSGRIEATGSVGSVLVGGAVHGGMGNGSGSFKFQSGFQSVQINGSVLGGGGASSGSIVIVGSAGSLAIGGDLVGGQAGNSGAVLVSNGLASLTIKGSVLGSDTAHAGVIQGGGDVGKIRIGGDLSGGDSAFGVDYSGEINLHKIGSVTVGGSLIAHESLGPTFHNGSIVSRTTIGSVAVGGGLHGAQGPVVISALGQTVQGAHTDLAIGKITVQGEVFRAQILAGYDIDGKGLNADAQIGAITAGAWSASDAVAGVSAGADMVFGSADDVALAGGKAAIISKIASFTVRGQALGFTKTGIVAQQIGALKVGAFSYGFTAAKTEVFRIGPTGGAQGDFFAREDV